MTKKSILQRTPLPLKPKSVSEREISKVSKTSPKFSGPAFKDSAKNKPGESALQERFPDIRQEGMAAGNRRHSFFRGNGDL